MRAANRTWIGLVLLAVATSAAAHDGGFGHSRRTLYIAWTPAGWSIEYRIALNRDEALIEMTRMDQDGDGQVSPEERDRYLAARSRQVAERLQVRDGNGAAIALKPIRCELGPTLTQTYRFTATTTARALLLEDGNFPHKPGLVQVRTGPGVVAELARPADLTHAERISVRVKKVESQ
jgi:hypothetical protein